MTLTEPESFTATETPVGRRSSAAPLAPPGGQPDLTGGVTDSQLAVLFRQAQWGLDEAAHDFPAGRVSAQRREELAASLEALAVIVRASTTETPAGRRSSDPRFLAPGGRPEPTETVTT